MQRTPQYLYSEGVCHACSGGSPPRGLAQATAISRRTLAEREVGGTYGEYIFATQLSRLVASTSSPPPLPKRRMSWSLLPLSWPIYTHTVLALALVLVCERVGATGYRHKPFTVDSSNLDAGITYSGASWTTDYNNPSEGVYFYGGSTMRAYNNGDSVEFAFTGPFLRPFLRPAVRWLHAFRLILSEANACWAWVACRKLRCVLRRCRAGACAVLS